MTDGVTTIASPEMLPREAVVSLHRPRLRRRLLHWAENGCYWSGLGAAYSWARRLSGAKILMYHSVAAPDEAQWIDPRNNTTPDTFRRHVEFLARHRRVVSLTDLVRAIDRGDDVPGGTVAITFDDGYVNTLRVAAPILAEFGLPMTVFLPTGYVGCKGVAWIDQLYTMFRTCSLTRLGLGQDNSSTFNLQIARDRDRAYKKASEMLVRAMGAEREEILADIEQQLKPSAKPPRLVLDWDEVRALVRDFPKVEIGTHTVEHIDLSNCTKEQATQEISDSIQDIERELGARPRHFSYPYGRVGTASLDVPRELGLHSALVTEPPERVTASSDQFALPRLEAPRSMSRLRFMTSAAHPDFSSMLTGRARSQ